jgi:hypothetical protein
MATTSGANNTWSNWKTFLMDTELAKHYKLANMVSGIGPSAPNPILEALLPSLLYMRFGALFDEVLEDYIATNNLTMSSQYRNNLHGRITFLNDFGKLKDAAKLHDIRDKRNQIAHDATQSCTWRDLEEAIMNVDIELQHLGLVMGKPQYEFYAERQPREQPESGYMMTFACCYGLKVGNTKVVEVSWLENIGKEYQA